MASYLSSFHGSYKDELVHKPRFQSGEGRNIIKHKLPIYHHKELNDSTRKSVLADMTLCGRSNSQLDEQWESWVLSYLAIAFTGLGQKIVEESGGKYELLSLPVATIDAIMQADDNIRAGRNPVGIPAIPGFPEFIQSYNVYLFNAASIRSVYGYAALLVFLMGKQITTANRANFNSTRAKNIINKFAIFNSQRYFLDGAGRLSDNALKFVNIAWNLSTGGRRATVQTLITFQGSSQLPYQIVYFMFCMLEHAYMQPAYFIHQLLIAVPEVATIPMLKPAILLYSQSVEEYGKYPAELRPYVKLMLGDSTKLFHSKSLQDLTSCAVLFLGQNNQAIRAYCSPGGERAKVLFKELCVKLGKPIKYIDFATGATIDL